MHDSVLARLAPPSLVLLPSAILPVGAALGVTITGRPVVWLPALLVTGLLLVAVAAAQRAYREETGRRRYAHATVRLGMFASILGVAYAVEPWAEPFDVIASMGMQLGIAIVAVGVVMVLAVADAEPRLAQIAEHAGLGLLVGLLGGLIVLFATLPLGMLWLEDWFPQTHRERFAVVLGCGLAGIAVLIHWLATRRQH